MSKKNSQTYDYVCFADLVYEFNSSETKKIEKKIKKRLKYYKLGAYNQQRVDYLRELKNELYQEISQASNSSYFRQFNSAYSELADFDTDRMTNDYLNKYQSLNKDELRGMINF